MSARILPMGERAFLLELGGLDEVLGVHRALAAARVEGIVDLVPAARTVLVRVDPRVLPLAAGRSWALAAASDSGEHHVRADPPLIEVDIAYDGADLADTAALLGVSADELARRHADAVWTVAFTGFAPGFGYLVSDAWPFDVPRLDAPRTRVPAGSVGLAGVFSGAYPRETPGGWRLIGTTDARLFDPDAETPALLAPGARVRFRPVPAPRSGDLARAGDPGRGRLAPARPRGPGATDTVAPPAATPAAPASGIRILEPGLLATVQDLGRPGAASVGVAVSGALDRAALRTANRLVGNPQGAAGIEITMGGLRAVALADTWFAVTGAWGPVRLDGRDVDPYVAHPWRTGTELHLDWFARGARGYLAVRGGLDGRVALGSRATDLMAGLGPGVLRAGDEIELLGDVTGPPPAADHVPWTAPDDIELDVELAPGPRADWFDPESREALFNAIWTVTNDADRVGLRLDGPELTRIRAGELPSEGMVPGALQVPPSGRPTILLADGPVTGGYPVIAAVTDAALDLLAQARPGTRIRFRHARPSR